MAGMTPDISTSSFKPLSLQEIMMVPLAKQKMENEFMAENSQVDQLTADVMDGDKERASKIVNDYKSKSSDMSSDVIDNGISKSHFNKLRRMRSSLQSEFGTDGFTGKAIANKKLAAKYASEMATNKDRQNGWSAKEAQSFASKNISKFNEKGTQNEDGSFNSFTGRELVAKVKTPEWINKNLDEVMADKVNYGLVGKQKISTFKDLLKLKKTEFRTYNKIMTALTARAAGDQDLKNSLVQEAELYGRDPEKALDFGSSEIVYDKDGKNPTVKWSVGESSFGMQLYGAAIGGAYEKDDSKYINHLDDGALALYKKGLKSEDADLLTRVGMGHVSAVTPENIADVRNSASMAYDEIQTQKSKLKITEGKYGKDSEEYKRQQGELNNALTTSQNLKEVLNGATETAIKNLSPSDKIVNDLHDEYSSMMSKLETPEAKNNFMEARMALRKELREKIIDLGKDPDDLLGQIVVKRNADYTSPEASFSFGPDGVHNLTAAWMMANGVPRNKINDYYNSKFPGNITRNINSVRKKVDKESSSNLKDQKYSISHIDIGAGEGGVIDDTNKTLTDNFDTASYTNAYTGIPTHTYIKNKYYGDAARINSPNGITKTVTVVHGSSPSGGALEKIIIRDKKTDEPLETLYITRGSYATDEHYTVAQVMMNSPKPSVRAAGNQMFNDATYMGMIRQGNLKGPAKSGKFYKKIELKFKDDRPSKKLDISWTRKEVQGIDDQWVISISGQEDSAPLGSQAEISNYLAEVVNGFNKK